MSLVPGWILFQEQDDQEMATVRKQCYTQDLGVDIAELTRAEPLPDEI